MNAITPFQFFETIFSEPLRHGQLMVWSKIRRSGKTATDWCHSLKKAARQVETYRNRREVFFGVALQDRQKALSRARQRYYRAAPTRVRGREESVTALPALWAELGIADAGGRQEARARIEEMSPPPSMMVWTGAAYQVYWLLAEAWVLEDEDDHRRAKRLLRKVAWALASAAGVEGWNASCSPRADLAGLMQVAGTFHEVAPQKAVPVVVERSARHRGEHRWAATDFEGLEDPPEQTRTDPWSECADPAAPGDRAAGAAADLLLSPPAPQGALRRVWEGCSWLRHCYHHQATLPEGEWAAALSIVGRCQAGPAAGGASLARSFSRRHPGYLPHHTDQQLERALRGKSGPATCRRVGRDLGAWDRHCSHCRYQGRIEGPIDLGQTEDSVPRPADEGAEKAVAEAAENPAPVTVEAGVSRQRSGRRSPAATAGGIEVEVVFRLSPGAGSPATWPPLLQAAIACLQHPLDLQGRRSAQNAGGRPDAGPGHRPPPASVAQRFFDGLEELVSALGGPATARRMVETLAAEENRERFDRLRSALRQLFPDAEGGVPTSRQLGYALRSYRRQGAGERTVVGVGRGPRGMTWAVRPLGGRGGDLRP